MHSCMVYTEFVPIIMAAFSCDATRVITKQQHLDGHSKPALCNAAVTRSESRAIKTISLSVCHFLRQLVWPSGKRVTRIPFPESALLSFRTLWSADSLATSPLATNQKIQSLLSLPVLIQEIIVVVTVGVNDELMLNVLRCHLTY